jgi:hypothetical protein
MILPETVDDADLVLDFPVVLGLVDRPLLLLTVNGIDQLTLELSR